MLKISSLIISIVIPQPEIYIQNPYAKHLSYESLYETEPAPNKNTMEYNVLKIEEMVKPNLQEVLQYFD